MEKSQAPTGNTPEQNDELQEYEYYLRGEDE